MNCNFEIISGSELDAITDSLNVSKSFSEFVIKNSKLFKENREGIYIKEYLPEHVINEILNKFESSIIENFTAGNYDLEACYCLNFTDVKHTILEKAICFVLDRIN